MFKFFKNKTKDKFYEIGKYTATLPHNHSLPRFQKEFKLYDRQLPRIAAIVEKYNPNTIILDIGANVGDSALAIRSACNLTIWCVEGEKYYLKYLKKNLGAFRNDISIYEFFLGSKRDLIRIDVQNNGTTARIKNSDSGQYIQVCHPSEIYEQELNSNLANPGRKNISFIKIDTDGFDFSILTGFLPYIEKNSPELYFEYEVNDKKTHNESIEIISKLCDLGYEFVIFDNFGNLMRTADNVDAFIEINKYLISCKENGGGIYYCDVLASKNSAIIKEASE